MGFWDNIQVLRSLSHILVLATVILPILAAIAAGVRYGIDRRIRGNRTIRTDCTATPINCCLLHNLKSAELLCRFCHGLRSQPGGPWAHPVCGGIETSLVVRRRAYHVRRAVGENGERLSEN